MPWVYLKNWRNMLCSRLLQLYYFCFYRRFRAQEMANKHGHFAPENCSPCASVGPIATTVGHSTGDLPWEGIISSDSTGHHPLNERNRFLIFPTFRGPSTSNWLCELYVRQPIPALLLENSPHEDLVFFGGGDLPYIELLVKDR